MSAFNTWMSQQDPDQKINYGLTLMVTAVLAGILIMLFLAPSHSEVDARNRISQRNHQRDKIECQAKGGLLGQPGYLQDNSVYSICHDVDSLIVLNGPRENNNESD